MSELIHLLSLPGIVIEEVKKDFLLAVLTAMQSTQIDFTDHYLSTMAKSRQIISFDKDFEKLRKL